MTGFDRTRLAAQRRRCQIELAWARSAGDAAMLRRTEAALARLDAVLVEATNEGDAT